MYGSFETEKSKFKRSFMFEMFYKTYQSKSSVFKHIVFLHV